MFGWKKDRHSSREREKDRDHDKRHHHRSHGHSDRHGEGKDKDRASPTTSETRKNGEAKRKHRTPVEEKRSPRTPREEEKRSSRTPREEEKRSSRIPGEGGKRHSRTPREGEKGHSRATKPPSREEAGHKKAEKRQTTSTSAAQESNPTAAPKLDPEVEAAALKYLTKQTESRPYGSKSSTAEEKSVKKQPVQTAPVQTPPVQTPASTPSKPNPQPSPRDAELNYLLGRRERMPYHSPPSITEEKPVQKPAAQKPPVQTQASTPSKPKMEPSNRNADIDYLLKPREPMPYGSPPSTTKKKPAQEAPKSTKNARHAYVSDAPEERPSAPAQSKRSKKGLGTMVHAGIDFNERTKAVFEKKNEYSSIGIAHFVNQSSHDKRLHAYGQGKKEFSKNELVNKKVVVYTAKPGHLLVLVDKSTQKKHPAVPSKDPDSKVSVAYNKDEYALAELPYPMWDTPDVTKLLDNVQPGDFLEL